MSDLQIGRLQATAESLSASMSQLSSQVSEIQAALAASRIATEKDRLEIVELKALTKDLAEDLQDLKNTISNTKKLIIQIAVLSVGAGGLGAQGLSEILSIFASN